ncbi:SPASM domain-containing protein [Nitrospinota bacterium]
MRINCMSRNALESSFNSKGVDYISHVKIRSNWLGATDDIQSPIPYALPCGSWFDINILCTGVVPLCCMDSNGDYAIGNVNENTVLEIYNKERFKNLRENEVSRESVFPCNTCANIQ